MSDVMNDVKVDSSAVHAVLELMGQRGEERNEFMDLVWVVMGLEENQRLVLASELKHSDLGKTVEFRNGAAGVLQDIDVSEFGSRLFVVNSKLARVRHNCPVVVNDRPPGICPNPECDKAGHCGGACSKDF